MITLIWLRGGNFERKNEYLLKSAQRNAIRFNYIEAKINNTQKNTKCRLYRDGDETLNP